MRSRRWIFIFLFIFLPAESFGQGFQHRRGWGHMPPPMEDWVKRLDLTEEQNEKIQEIRDAYRRDTLSWRNELMVKRFHLRDLMEELQAAPERILNQQREISEVEAKIQERTILFQFELRKILTSEQIKMLPQSYGPGGFHEPAMMPGRGRGMGRE
jgi:Spy/CpxP family protein refolding chaperone